VVERLPRILVVDDTPAGVEVLETILVPCGYEVIGASTGLEALRLAFEARPELILLDVLMPEMDGYEVCQRLRANPVTQFLPVVMVTASHDPDKIRAIESGADDFIQKPIDRAELLARLVSLLRIKRYHDTIEAQAAELTEWNRTLATRVAEQVQDLERLSRLRRFLSPQLAEILASVQGESLLETHRSLIAVACCELQGFTTLAELADPEEVVGVLREYHHALDAVIRRFEGTVGALEEDRLTIFFNDPLPSDDPAGQAVRLAVAMRERMARLIATWHNRGYALEFAVGVDLGHATLGTIGLEGRSEYGAIGIVGRLAWRLCQQARGGQILVTQRTHAALRDQFVVSLVGDLSLEGFTRPVVAYSIDRLLAAVDPATSGDRTRLSRREQEVVGLVARGLTNRQIAEQLVLSERTVEAHVARICAKLDVRSRVQVAAWAVEHAGAGKPGWIGSVD
jgi:adenylate cyclase